MPKFNLYQSLHTTVVGPQGKPLEVQIRTREMHQRAELGVAAHWALQGASSRPTTSRWLNRIVDWQRETTDPDEFMADAEGRPRAGRGLRLHAQGRGHHAARSAPRRSTSPTPSTPRSATRASAPRSTAGWCRSTTQLTSGDTVEIFTSKVEGAGPSPRLAEDRRHAPRPRQDPPVVLPGAPRGRHRDRPGGAGQGAAPRGPARSRSCSRRNAAAPRSPTALNYVDLDALARRHRRAPRVGQVGRRSAVAKALRDGGPSRKQLPDHRPRSPAGPPDRPAPPACTSRGSTT